MRQAAPSQWRIGWRVKHLLWRASSSRPRRHRVSTSSMNGLTILGSGRYLPGSPVDNTALARVMSTDAEWIFQRTGIAARHFAPESVGASDLALPAARQALEASGLQAEQIDYLLFNTMTPDYVFPGSGALLGAKLGIPGVPALDLRQQCAAMPYSFQVADALVKAGAARHVLIVGAEAHAGFMPWRDWSLLEENSVAVADERDFARATEHRGMSILFGDGAGALVLGQREGSGFLGAKVHSDGRLHSALRVEAGGFRKRPFLDHAAIDSDDHIPRMNGRELFKSAVRLLPQVVRELCAKHGVSLADIDWFIAHQANDRINVAVRDALGLPAHKVPSNIARYGNTSSATIPILVDEMLRDGQLQRGQLVCFMALGAGLNWGAALLRL
ncbi:MAG: 3-oxoacyl-[acyl-carrier-protein] synthase [Myxococcaceae bacterium]|nr:3-oxoacyl-[acyl-carrier-protein] synthase [Myxococcaceae bacterium]